MSWLKLASLAVALAVVVGQQLDLDQGKVRGIVKTTPMGSVTEFLGIPYADPPIGDARYLFPKYHKGWQGTYDARAYKPACMQSTDHLKYRPGFDQAKISAFKMSEDCLYLNVFVKGGSVPASGDPRPVMIWFHGGLLVQGSGELIGSTSAESPEAIVSQGDVILVTFNYRLGVLGFFTTGDQNANANNGLWDQHMAMAWVKKNIGKFGGDPNKITVFGDEDGALSISYHMVSPTSGGLFQRAAMSSHPGYSMLTPDVKEYKKYAFMIADGMGCTNKEKDYVKSMKCMRDTPAAEILAKTPKHIPHAVVDRKFLPDEPRKLWAKGAFVPIDIIVGCNNGDGDHSLFASPDAEKILKEGITMDMAMKKEILPYFGYPMRNSELGRTLHKMVSFTYGTHPMTPTTLLYDIMKAKRDAFDCAPAMTAAYYNGKAGGRTYMYYFTHISPSTAEKYKDAGIPAQASFGSQVWYVVGDPTMESNGRTQAKDINLAKSMMTAWSSFAKTGKPQFLDDQSVATDWPAYKKTEGGSYVQFESPMTKDSIKTGGINANASIFWNVLLPTSYNAMLLHLPMNVIRKPMMPGDKMAKPEAKGQAEGEGKGESEAEAESEFWKMMGRPKPEGHWRWVNGEAEGKGEAEGESEGKGGANGEYGAAEREGMGAGAEAEQQKAAGIAFWVMMAFVVLLVIMVTIMMCLVCIMRRRL